MGAIAETILERIGNLTRSDVASDIVELDRQYKKDRFALKSMYRVCAERDNVEPDYDTARRAAAKAEREESEAKDGG